MQEEIDMYSGNSRGRKYACEVILVQLPRLPTGNLDRFRGEISRLAECFHYVPCLNTSAIDVHARLCARVRVTMFSEITGIDYPERK